MMSEKKCKVCGATAEWEFDSDYYCEDCLCTEFEVQWNDRPRVCEMCGKPLDKVYYTEDEGYPFCSRKCALEFHGASRAEEVQDDGEA